ncbi:MAG: BspA family leucine-rich repeat surface protein, partial [Clostridium sp.]|nr:BspA family leucine-rich repeat surface protein [Clostridium sp.]
MNKVLVFLKEHKYLMVALVLVGISITLGVTYSNYIVTSNNHKVAEMYIGTLKYSMTIDGTTTNTLSVPSGETIVDVTITNENPIDTYYKLIYQNNSNITIKYYESIKDTNDNVTNYSSPNDKITSSGKNTIKLKITNSSTSSQTVTFKIVGGFATNTLNDVIVPAGYTIIEKDTSTNTYFCTTTDTLTQGLKYVNGQYTYAYKQQGRNASSGIAWDNINNNGWGVQLTDKASTDAVTSNVCTYINNKPIISMSYMFYKSQATTLDASNFDTSKVTNMDRMFDSSRATTLDVSNFNTSNVTNMDSMFVNSKATTLDLSNFDTSNVIDMAQMFYGIQATTLDLSNFNTSKVTDMNRMFTSSQVTTLDLSNFDTSKVTDMSHMFSNSQATTLDLSNFNTSNVTNMSYMFFSSKATTLDLSSFDTSKVTDMGYMFMHNKATTLDLSSFDTSKVTDMDRMFASSQATTLDLSSFNTSNVTSMSSMFDSATNLKTIYASDKFNTDNVTTSTNMFLSSTNLVGGAGTKYNSSHVDKAYAHIDGGTSNPGYFTDIADKDIPAPNSFATDSWKTIIKAVRNNNISKYNVGDTKTIDMGTYGTHTLRIANTSTPSECSRAGFSQTACGFVLEFADIITNHKMNDTDTNVGGWPSTSMRTFVNTDIYNAIPSEIKNVIIDTTVVSGHGSTSGETNFTSTDKLYLLSTAEVW